MEQQFGLRRRKNVKAVRKEEEQDKENVDFEIVWKRKTKSQLEGEHQVIQMLSKCCDALDVFGVSQWEEEAAIKTFKPHSD